MTAAVAGREFQIMVPQDWGIRKLYAGVQEAVDRFFGVICGAGFEPREAVRVWLEVVQWKVERRPISILHKAREMVKERIVRPGRLLGQLGLLAQKLIRRTVKLFADTDDEQVTVVPAFFHSQLKIANALLLGGERDEKGAWRPKPVQRRPDGELLDPPGVRHTRDLLEICTDELELLEAFDRTTEKGHVLNHEARTTVHVLKIPEDAMGFLRELYARWHGEGSGGGSKGSAKGNLAAPPARKASTASPAAAPAPFVPAATAPEPVRQLQAIYLTRHEAKYRPLDTRKGRPYAQGDPRMASERWPETAEALKSFAQRAGQAALAKGHSVRPENVLTGICEKIVDLYLAGSSPWLNKTRHCLAGVWSESEKAKTPELFLLGPRAVDAWIESLGEPVHERRAEPAAVTRAAAAPELEEVDENAPIVEIIDDGTVPETEADRQQARAAGAARRAQFGCELGELERASTAADSDSEPPTSEREFGLRPRHRRSLTAEQVRDLADIDAGRAVWIPSKPPPSPPAR